MGYDGLGRRINKTVRHTNGTTATTHFGWDGDRIVREESDSQRSTIVYEPGRFVPMLSADDNQQGQVLSAFVTDALGTPMQLVAANGETKWQAQPDDWKAVKNVRGNTDQPIRFQGQWHDEESGLYYNRHRYYDPHQGRYISQDPIGLNGGTNLYGYVGNPTGIVDPLGLNAIRTAMMADEIRSKSWCVAQDVALRISRSQLPDILQEEIDSAQHSRASGIEQCKREHRNALALGKERDVARGDFNSCEIDVIQEYNDRLNDLSKQDAARNQSIDDSLNGILWAALFPPRQVIYRCQGNLR